MSQLSHTTGPFECDLSLQKPITVLMTQLGKTTAESAHLTHNQPVQRVKDEERQKILETMGLNFLRFSEMQVRKDMELVLKAIENYVLDYEAKHPEIKERPSRYRK